MAKAIKPSPTRRNYFNEAIEMYEGKSKRKLQPKRQHVLAVVEKLMLLMVKTEQLGVAMNKMMLRKKLNDMAKKDGAAAPHPVPPGQASVPQQGGEP